MENLKGNAPQYALCNVQPLGQTPLSGKHICFLGSSVTFGACSCEESMVEFISKRNGCTYVKNAVSGTMLVDNGETSYIARMKTVDTSEKFDAFVCQLSTNDTKLGMEQLDTVADAIRFIIEYVQKTWDCPMVFYTGSYFKNEMYAKMVEAVKALRANYPQLSVIDLYTDEEFNSITDEARELYMRDPVHPTRAGYLKWWTPKIEQHLYSLFEK